MLQVLVVRTIPIANSFPNLGLNKNRGMPRRFNIDEVKWLKEGDVYLGRDQHQLNSNDLVILVMGFTGAGKSTFINNVLDALAPGSGERAVAEDSFESCTGSVAHYAVDLPKTISQRYNFRDGCRLILVDTPGFGNSTFGNEEVLRRIAVWLASSYGIGIKVAGVVYVHAIGAERLTASHISGLNTFKKICGEDALTKTVLATTRWNLADPHELKKREGELRKELWEGMPDDSATALRLDDTTDSAYDVVKTVLRRVSGPSTKLTVLLLQQEIVDQGSSYAKTSAGLITAKRRAGFSTKLVAMFKSLFRLP